MELPEFKEISLLQALASAALFSVLYYIWSVVYCLYFHPLAKYPGPFWAKFSIWPSYYHTIMGNRHIWIWQCHEIYGSVFRNRPDGLLFNTPGAFQAIYQSKSNVKKGKFYEMYPRKAGSHNTWNCVDKLAHARKRRILNAAFSDKALKASEPYIVRHADRWCELLLDGADKGWSCPRNVAEWSDYLVFDILGELCYARSLNIKEPGATGFKHLPKLMMEYTTFHYLAAWSPLRNTWLWLKPKGLDRLLEIAAPKNVQAWAEFVDSCLTQRIVEEKKTQEKDVATADVRRDMFHHIFGAKDPETGGPGYTQEELFAESNLLVVAGSDTTSTTFAAMFFYLTRNPEVYRRLTSEIRTTFKSVEDIHTGPQLNSCRYLRAFIDESLRMNPPVPADMDREALVGGITVEGQSVPEGTSIGVSLYSLHHNGEIFPEPFSFKPERWIPSVEAGVTAASVGTYDSAFAPFSTGLRGCPGKNLAYLEMSVTMAKLLFLSDVRAVEGNDLGAGKANLMWGRKDTAHFQTWDVFVSIREGPIVQFKSVQR